MLLCRIRKRSFEILRPAGYRPWTGICDQNGTPLDRANIWRDMKRLCADAGGGQKKKVFPINLRHLFARTFYNLEKDIVRLADILGHSSVETSRIYTMSSGQEHQRQLAALHLIL